MSGRKLLVGADIGGTFTDLVIADRVSGEITNVKTLTTPIDPAQGVLTAVKEGLELIGAQASDIERFVHATTLPTNLVLERKGAKVAFIATNGFGDMFDISRQFPTGPHRFNVRWKRPPSLSDRGLVVEIDERMGPHGDVWKPLDAKDAEERLKRLIPLKPEAFAVCLLHSYANAAHEQAVGEIIARVFPGVQVYLSSEVWPEFREYERGSATVLSAYVGPTLSIYASRLNETLKGLGVKSELQIMQSSGAIMSVTEAVRRAAYTIESGPAAGVMAASYVGRASGRPDVISFDMGGTTAKAGLVIGGRPRIANEFRVGGHASSGGQRDEGEPIRIPVIDLAEVGAGGGSIAWVDPGGHLRLGPQSAGASPGPACYDQGGTEATVTDANIVLGYLDASYFNGGKMKIKPELSHAAIDKKIAKPLGISVVDAARGIHSLANTLMGSAIRIVTLQRGIDPRDHAIIAFGGAGPIHIVHLAQLFDIKEVIVPLSPGVKSAYGLLISDVAYDTVKTLMMKVDGADLSVLRKHFNDLEAKARGVLAGETQSGSKIVVERYIDMSFATKFQTHPVLVPNQDIDTDILAAAEKEFRAVQFKMFGAESADRCRVMGVRVHAYAPVDIPEQRKAAKAKTGPDAAIKNRRQAWFAATNGFTETPVYNRMLLSAGHSFVGPAIIEEPDSTTICPPGYTIVVDDELNLIITASGGSKSDKSPKRAKSDTVREPA